MQYDIKITLQYLGEVCHNDHAGGYKSTLELSVEDHRKYHDPQIKLFGEDPRIDYVLAGPLADVKEAKGIISAALKHRTPLVISFTLRKRDCKLPSGQSLQVWASISFCCKMCYNNGVMELIPNTDNVQLTAPWKIFKFFGGYHCI